jgi:predicted butyrate kinase (DUF1464 family)
MLRKGISLKNVRNRVQPMVAKSLAEGGAIVSNSLAGGGAIITNNLTESGTMVSKSLIKGGVMVSNSLAEGGTTIANNLAEGSAMLANSLPESGAIRKPQEFLEVSQTTSPRICDNLKCQRICAVTDTSTRLSPAQLAFGLSE